MTSAAEMFGQDPSRKSTVFLPSQGPPGLSTTPDVTLGKAPEVSRRIVRSQEVVFSRCGFVTVLLYVAVPKADRPIV